MSNTTKGYRAVHEKAGWRDLSNRGKIEVTGPDRVGFLHALTTNEVESMDDYQVIYNALLTSKGKFVSDFYLYRFPERIVLDSSENRLEDLYGALEGYIIMDDVNLSPVKEVTHISVQGPDSTAVISQLFDRDVEMGESSIFSFGWNREEIWLIRKSDLGSPGYELIFPDRIWPGIQQHLEGTSGVESVSDFDYQILRIEKERPLWGQDFDERNNPVEIGLQTAFSLTKGCFVGQEVVSKAIRIGRTARKLVRFESSRSRPPGSGESVYDSDGQKIGWITSAVYSPKLEKTIGFVYLKRSYAETTSEYRLLDPREGQIRIVNHFKMGR